MTTFKGIREPPKFETLETYPDGGELVKMTYEGGHEHTRKMCPYLREENDCLGNDPYAAQSCPIGYGTCPDYVRQKDEKTETQN